MSSFYTSCERSGNFMLWRGYHNGNRFSKKVPYKPTFYLPTKEQSEYTSFITNKPLKPKRFDTIKDSRDFLERYKEVDGFEIYGNTNFLAQFIQEKYPTKIQFDISKINIVTFDLEVDISTSYADTETADKRINSISAKSSKSDTYWLFGLKPYDKTKTTTGLDPEKIEFVLCDDEKDLLTKFIRWWTNDYPDVVSGWNSVYFDVQYLVTRIIRLFGEDIAKKLSPWGYIRKISREFYGKIQSTWIISGVESIDYMDAFKKFGYKYGPQESYKLDHIAYVVLGSKKLDYSVYGGLTELYDKNPQLYLDYNIQDTSLVVRMEEETALLQLVMTIAYDGGVNYNDAFGTVGIWDTTIFRKLMSKKLVPPVKTGSRGDLGELVGGYVKDPKIGLHKWIVSFDLNSLYPMTICTFNMSPETLMKHLRLEVDEALIQAGLFKNESEYAVAANGTCYRKDILGVLPEIINEYYAERSALKKQMLQKEQELENTDKAEKDLVHLLKKQIVQLFNGQMAKKISLNSLYGAVANIYFLYFIKELAEGITTSGQMTIRYAEKVVNEFMNRIMKTENIDYVIMSDTDSLYVNFDSLVEQYFPDQEEKTEEIEKFLDQVCKQKVESLLEEGYSNLTTMLGAYTNKLSMKREKINDRAIVTGKKRYILNTLNSEGVHYSTPKISVTGIESVRSSTPEICREKMKELFGILMTKTEKDVQEFIEQFREEFNELEPHQIGKTMGVDDLTKYLDKTGPKKNCPINYRGSFSYNTFLKKKGLENRYAKISGGDKVQILYLKKPNPTRENVICFPGVLPKEMLLQSYIDYDTQFDKVFLNPMDAILKTIGWSAIEVTTLEDFFSC